MEKVEFSQIATDTIGIIFAICITLTILLILGALIYYIFKVVKPIKDLEKEKLRIEIENLREKIKNDRTKARFIQAQAELMEKKAQK